jgi:pachytene checkpoint protein 2
MLQAAVSGSEPSDAIRAVNALLTQLDGLKRYPNVMVLTTSNITEAIDAAFVDRADIKVGGCACCPVAVPKPCSYS